MKINEKNQSQIIKKLLELTGENSTVRITPEELLNQMWEFGIASKRDLAITLKKFGLRTKVFYINRHHARYYILVKNELVQVQAHFEAFTLRKTVETDETGEKVRTLTPAT